MVWTRCRGSSSTHPTDVGIHGLSGRPPPIAEFAGRLVARIPSIFANEMPCLAERERHPAADQPLDKTEYECARDDCGAGQGHQWTRTIALPRNQHKVLRYREPVASENVTLTASAVLHRQYQAARGVCDVDHGDTTGKRDSQPAFQTPLDGRVARSHAIVERPHECRRIDDHDGQPLAAAKCDDLSFRNPFGRVIARGISSLIRSLV